MKQMILTVLAVMMALTALAQELPQFTSGSFDGWTYNNPNIPLTADNIANGRIVLYVGSGGEVLMLTSPQFCCQGIDTIAASVLWYTATFQSSGFDLSRTALTMVIDDSMGQPVDSMTCVPTTMGSSRTLHLQLAVPQGLDTCRLRFVSWSADVKSSGAVKRALITGIAAPPHDDTLLGDVDGDNHISIADVSALIDILLFGGATDPTIVDIDQDGQIAIGDVTALIDLILHGAG